MATKRLSAYNIDPTTKELLTAMLADIQNAGVAAAVATDLANLRAAVVAITAKLDLDAGVTDANYAATCNPAAITAVPVASAQVIA